MKDILSSALKKVVERMAWFNVWSVHSDLFLKHTVWRDRQRSEFTVGSSDGYCLSQLIKITLSNHEPCRWYVPSVEVI